MSGLDSLLKGQFGPVDRVKGHAAVQHFGFEIGSVLLPIGRLSNAEPGLLAEANKFIVGFEGAADAECSPWSLLPRTEVSRWR